MTRRSCSRIASSLGTVTPSQKSAVRTSAIVGATALHLRQVHPQVVELRRAPRPSRSSKRLDCLRCSVSSRQTSRSKRWAASLPPMLRHCIERGDLAQQPGLGRRVELAEQVRVLERLDLLPLLLDGDGLARQVGDVPGDQADGRLERLGVGLLERGLGELDPGLEDHAAAVTSPAWARRPGSAGRRTRSSSSGRRSGSASCAGRGRRGSRRSRVPRPIICQNLT